MRTLVLFAFLFFIGCILSTEAQVLRMVPIEKPSAAPRPRIQSITNTLGVPKGVIPRTIQSADDMFWDTQFGISSSSDLNIKSIVEHDGKIYVSGFFSNIGDTVYNSIAIWNGERWLRLGMNDARGTGVLTETQLPGSINCSAVAPNGDLYIGGSFVTAGGKSCNNIAKWNGVTFEPLSQGVNGMVNSMVFIGDNLYIGGNFSIAGSSKASRIAKWDGSNFEQVKNGIDDGFVNVLVAKGTQLFVGGSFKRIDSVGYNSIVAYNTQTNSWNSLAGGVFYTDPNKTANVFSIAITSDNMLYVGGLFEKAGNISARNIAQWNGTQWNNLSTGANEAVTTLYADDNTLYVSGGFDEVGGVSSIFLAKWNSGAWQAISNPLQGNASTIVKSGTLFYLGGNFELEVSPTFTTRGFAVWDGIEWFGIGKNKGNGINGGTVTDLVSNQRGQIIAAGTFVSAGSIKASGIAQFNGTIWETLGQLELTSTTAALKHSGDHLLLAGNFSIPGKLAGLGLVKYNYESGEVTKLAGIKGPLSSNVQAIELHGTNTYIAGNFRMIESDSVQSIAMFDGTSWKKLGDGLSGGNVLCLAVSPSGTLYAGGTFTRSGTTTLNNIAEWNGSSWQAVGGGVQGAVNTMRWSNGTLYVGGSFKKVGTDVDAANIAKFSPSTSTWQAIGNGCSNTVNAIEIAGNYLYAGGAFRIAGTDSCNRVARYSISEGTWAALGSGIQGGTVYSLVATSGSLYIGGDFFTAGLKPSRGIAHWMRNPTSVEVDKTQQTTNNFISVYPNPAQTIVRVQRSDIHTSNATIQVYSVHGTLMLSTEASAMDVEAGVSIPTDNLPNGAYMIRISAGATIYTAPMVIAR